MRTAWYLADARFGKGGKTATIPVLDGWNWQMTSPKTGYLEGPDGAPFCSFDLVKETLTFEPGGAPTHAPGLSLDLVQEMGEQYVNDLLFSEREQQAYVAMDAVRKAEKKAYEKSVYHKHSGILQLEKQGSGWLTHVDTGALKELAGIETNHVCSRAEGIALFNQACRSLGAKTLYDPTGYMSLPGNVYAMAYQEYENQYEDVLQAIDNGVVDGTGYGVEAVLKKLPTTIRQNFSNYCVPKGEAYGDLRFVKATGEMQSAIHEFVKARVSLTLIYEKKRSYEKATVKRAEEKYETAGKAVQKAIYGDVAEVGQAL